MDTKLFPKLAIPGSALIACFVLAGPLGAQQELLQLTASNGENGDYFGRGVAIDDYRIVVGAFLDQQAGVESGSAYVFDALTGAELLQLTPTDGASGQGFGKCVDIDGDRIVIGAAGDGELGSVAGAAYVFDAVTGAQLFKLLASDGAPFDFFGTSVAISDDRVVVGAYLRDNLGAQSGSAYVFDAETGQELFKLTANDGAAGDAFGTSVAIGGDWIVVGAVGDDDLGDEAGSAYVFDAETGVQLAKMLAIGGAAGDAFGTSVAMSGPYAVVGAPEAAGTGIAYLFDVASGLQLQTLLATDGSGGDQFGIDVDFDADLVVVGARWDDDVAPNAGSTYLFDPWIGEQLAKLTVPESLTNDELGSAVAIENGYLLSATSRGDHARGRVHVFAAPADCNGNGIPDGQDIALATSPDCNLNWVPDECELDSGSSADCNLNGVPDECDIAGGLESDLNLNGIPDSCECLVSNYCLSGANSSGAPAEISVLGIPSVSDNDLTLRVTSSAIQQFGMFFYGSEQQAVLFGDGLLCIKQPIYRISPVVLSDAVGDVNLTVDFTSGSMGGGPGKIEPFATWNFQYWFRDHPAGGAGFNLSDGLQVTFCP